MLDTVVMSGDDVCCSVVFVMIYACVLLGKQFELLEFVFDSVYVDLQYDEIYFSFTAGNLCLCGVCSPWSVCEVVVVPYVVGATWTRVWEGRVMLYMCVL